MDRIAIDKAYDPVEVDLWGEVFYTQDVTADTEEKLGELWQELAEVERTEADGWRVKRVECLGRMLDLRLGREGKGKKPSTLVKERYQANKLSFARLMEFLADLGNAEGQDRPTD